MQANDPLPELDLRGHRAPEPLRRLTAVLRQYSGRRVRVRCDDPTFLVDIATWASALRISIVESRQHAGTTMVDLDLPPLSPQSADALSSHHGATSALGSHHGATAALNSQPMALTPPVGPQPTADPEPTDVLPRENLATLLVLKNDVESLMASLMVANAAASAGMTVEVTFAFWGINLLRGERPRPDARQTPLSLLHRLLRWLMPKGPHRQKLSQLHLGGVGKGLLEHFIRQDNVMGVPQLLDACVENNVKFAVCTMSMGLLGVRQCDIMDLPNIEWGGVTQFVAGSRQASLTLVF